MDSPERMAAVEVLGLRYRGSFTEMVRLSDCELSANNRIKILLVCMDSGCTFNQVIPHFASGAQKLVDSRKRRDSFQTTDLHQGIRQHNI